MVSFHLQTLIDITRTGVYRKENGTDLTRAQQQNFDMMLQTIGMRANPIYDYSPACESINLADYQFGDAYTGIHSVWNFTFHIERADCFLDEFNNECGLLLNDINHVPIIADLLETAAIMPYFDTKNSRTRNTLIFPFVAKYSSTFGEF